MSEAKVVGYWRQHKNPKKCDWEDKFLPWPIADELNYGQRVVVFNAIVKKQKTALLKHYRGWTNSRITGEKLGSAEFVTSKFIWPFDYSSHYILQHGVKPPDDFLKWLKVDLDNLSLDNLSKPVKTEKVSFPFRITKIGSKKVFTIKSVEDLPIGVGITILR